MANGIVTGPDLSEFEPLAPESPAVGLPEDSKGRPRIDFDGSAFDVQIETKGLRVAWSRASVCPCTGNNPQTLQPDPTCPLCEGRGFLYFRAAGYDVDDYPGVGELSEVQRHIVNRATSPAMVIRAVGIGMERSENAYDRIGQWGEGTVNITTRQNHKLGHFDRLTYLDSVLAYAQTAIAPSPSDTPFRLRFPALRVNFLRTTAARYEQGVDFVLDDEGRVCFQAGRGPQGTNVPFAAHYLHHPQFIVMSWLNAIRDSVVLSKRQAASTRTPVGSHQQLPTRVVARLEFLAGPGLRSNADE